MNAASSTSGAIVKGWSIQVEECRQRLVSGLAAVPEGTLLTDYFERGKMIRAHMVFASASAVGGDPERATCAAEAVELLHGASLFHDDLIDGADKRRGLPALHRRVSPADAVLLGDFLLLRAFVVLSGSARPTASSEQVVAAVRVLGEHAQACCRGQRLELALSGQLVSEDAYFAVAEDKTSAPFMAAVALGAILSGGGPCDRDALVKYARHLGVAFQICDDMLDFFGNPEVLGKPVGNSLARRRPSLALTYLVTYGSAAARRAWEAFDQYRTPLVEMQSLLDREGILARVRATQSSRVAAALAALDGMPESEGLQMLVELPASILLQWG